jgi:hypothetical protein
LRERVGGGEFEAAVAGVACAFDDFRRALLDGPAILIVDDSD